MKILLEAPILTQSGYGEHSRLVFKSIFGLKNVQVYTNPLSWGQTSWSSEYDDFRKKIDNSITLFRNYEQSCAKSKSQPHYDLQIHVGILNELVKKSHQTISITAGIETDRVSPEWILKTHQGVDKIIVPSEHARSGFVNSTYETVEESTGKEGKLSVGAPVSVVPYPVKKIVPKHIPLKLDTKFNFLSVALLGPRKNLENTIKWFIEEFKNDDIGLILKTGRARGSILDKEYTLDHLRNVLSEKKYQNRKCKIYLLHGDLTESEISSLYQRDDIHCYLSATHGEGYGLPIFEASYSGLPVVAPAWSGHLDFLRCQDTKKNLFAKVDFDLKEIPKEAVWRGILMKESKWAIPRKNSFKKQIRSVYKNHGMYKKWADKLKQQLSESHLEDKVLEKMRMEIFGFVAKDLIETPEQKAWREKLSSIEKL